MNKTFKIRSSIQVGALLGMCILAGCANRDGRSYPGGYGYPNSGPRPGYNEPYYSGNARNNDYYRRREWESARHDRLALERERERAEEARRRSEYEGRYRPPPVRYNQPCPPGYSPREQSCTPHERKRGCKDIRLPSGQGCVNP